MLFVSFAFLLFLPICFLLYWGFARHFRLQNLFIVCASYIFYGWADWRYLGLIFGYTLWSFISGLLLEKIDVKWQRKLVFYATICLNLGVLSIYKYFDFFVDGFGRILNLFGVETDWPTLNLILPIGISFFTFQALSYTIDVYSRKLKATRDIISFFAFLSFFPQLVAGPIERADTLLPQFQRKRVFRYSEGVEGMKMILWGFFKKMVIADNCANVVDKIFGDIYHTNSLTLMTGAILFSFQIYGDFSGYSSIARGCGKLFGVNLMQNFNLPYFSKSLKEFWRRWHISLNLWLRDYIYFPLGGNRNGGAFTVLNLLIVFAISGLWHGAKWTYIIWGLLNGILISLMIFSSVIKRKYLIDSKELQAEPENKPKEKGIILSILSACAVFGIVTLLWVVFRSTSISSAWYYIKNIFSFKGVWALETSGVHPCLIFIVVMLILEFINRRKADTLNFPNTGILKLKSVRWFAYWLFALATFVFAGNEAPFIYFQF